MYMRVQLVQSAVHTLLAPVAYSFEALKAKRLSMCGGAACEPVHVTQPILPPLTWLSRINHAIFRLAQTKAMSHRRRPITLTMHSTYKPGRREMVDDIAGEGPDVDIIVAPQPVQGEALAPNLQAVSGQEKTSCSVSTVAVIVGEGISALATHRVPPADDILVGLTLLIPTLPTNLTSTANENAQSANARAICGLHAFVYIQYFFNTSLSHYNQHALYDGFKSTVHLQLYFYHG